MARRRRLLLLALLALAVGVCEGDVWETSMWEVPARDPAHPLAGPSGELATDPISPIGLVGPDGRYLPGADACMPPAASRTGAAG